MNRFTTGAIRPDSDEVSRVLRRLADTTQTAYCLLDGAADFPRLPRARDTGRLRAIAFLLGDLSEELGALAARIDDTQTAEGGAA